MEDKLIRDMLGSPVPQYYNMDLQTFSVQTTDGSLVTNVDFSQTKLLRDRLGSPIPQLWDAANNKWVVDDGSYGGTGGSTSWENIENKPTTFPPATHSHSVSDITGLQAQLDAITSDYNALRKRVGNLELDVDHIKHHSDDLALQYLIRENITTNVINEPRSTASDTVEYPNVEVGESVNVLLKEV